MTVAIAAAGTGGHVLPALAVAEALQAAGLDRSAILFLGGDRIEAKLVPEAGYELHQYEVSGLPRSPTVDGIKVAIQTWRASGQVKSLLAAAGTRVVLAMGGYITGSAALAARRLGRPLVLHEQNAIPGLANRLASRWAARIFVAYESAREALPGAELVGNPLRAEILQPVSRAHACRHYGLDPDLRVVGILGGSQGADALNRAAPQLLADGVQLLHLAGPGHPSGLGAGEERRWLVKGFEDEMHFFYAACDIVVSRAGALAIAELAATGTPAVLVPYTHGTADHQLANAAPLVEAGGAELVFERDLGQLPKTVEAMLAGDLSGMSVAARTLSRPQAADVIAAAVMELAGA
jgi:UDP-N-acetylglucosamine--N-acetylmuramyl-(pentapeptide) pyrophosphoryl-undecaprenol N-acetylglucosamine transferase